MGRDNSRSNNGYVEKSGAEIHAQRQEKRAVNGAARLEEYAEDRGA